MYVCVCACVCVHLGRVCGQACSVCWGLPHGIAESCCCSYYVYDGDTDGSRVWFVHLGAGRVVWFLWSPGLLFDFLVCGLCGLFAGDTCRIRPYTAACSLNAFVSLIPLAACSECWDLGFLFCFWYDGSF